MLELIVIILLLLLNGMLAMSEIAFVSAKKFRLQEKAKRGNGAAIKALKLLEKPEKFLSAVQIGITLVGILAGAFGGYAMADDIVPFFDQFDSLRKYSAEISFAVIVTFITYLSLIIGELVPKSIALNNPDKITLIMAPLLFYITKIFSPFVWLLSFSSNALLAVLGIKKNEEPPITEEELKSLLDLGTKHGTFEMEESEIIKKVFSFNDKKINSIMIPRSEIEWIGLASPVNKIIEFISMHNYSRYLVCKDDLDNVAGILESKEFLVKYTSDPSLDIRSVLTEPLFVPQTMYTIDLLEKFKTKKSNMAVAIDEYGGTQGLVTLHDIIENVLGELPEKFDLPENYIVQRKDGTYLIDGLTEINEIEKLFNLEITADDYSTIGGFIMQQLGKIPEEGDSIIFQNYKFEVVDMDGNRVDKVLMTKQ